MAGRQGGRQGRRWEVPVQNAKERKIKGNWGVKWIEGKGKGKRENNETFTTKRTYQPSHHETSPTQASFKKWMKGRNNIASYFTTLNFMYWKIL